MNTSVAKYFLVSPISVVFHGSSLRSPPNLVYIGRDENYYEYPCLMVRVKSHQLYASRERKEEHELLARTLLDQSKGKLCLFCQLELYPEKEERHPHL